MIKINIGCGPNGQIKGFENLDNSPSIILHRFPRIKFCFYKMGIVTENQYNSNWKGVIRCNASKHLPYKDESIDKIYSSHFLEHIPKKKGEFFLKECYRVLKKDGIMRLVVPDLFFHAKKYIDGTKEIIDKFDFPDDRTVHDKFLKSVYGAYLEKKRFGAEHCYMYDYPSLLSLLKTIKFKKIQKQEFQMGFDLELSSFDSRPEDSLHLEIIK